MASIVTQSDQNGPKWVQSVQNGSKTGPTRGPKGGPKMGPPEVGTKKKSKNIFSLAPLQGVKWPPSKNHGFGKFPPISDLTFSDWPEKCGGSPLRMAQRGKTPHFEPPPRDGGSDIGGNFLKNWPKKGGTSILGTFWRFWGFPVKTVCNPGLPGNPSQQRKRHTDLRGSSQRSLRGSIWALDTQGGQNRPSGGPMR